MAELKFNCSKCGQLIACDELWIGHQINCPTCQTELSVPAQQEAPKPANPLVPQVPGATKLSIGQARHQSSTPPPQAGAGATGATSFRARVGAPKKKKGNSPAVKYAIAGVCVIAIAAVGYFVGYPQYQKWQDKKKAEEEAKAAEAAKAAAATNAPPQPAIIAPVFTLEVATANIPEGKVNGMVSGTNFVPDSVRLDKLGPAEVLQFVQGQPTSPDREVLVYLYPKAGETLAGHTWTVSQDQKTGVPQVGKRWKPDPSQQPKVQTYPHGYAMKLELGQMNGSTLPGKIYLALNDGQQTVVAGKFDAAVSTSTATPVMATPPAAQNPNARYTRPPPPPNAARTPVEQRYGVQ